MRGRKNDESKINIESKAEGEINAFLCPISSEIFKDPVFAADGHTYERAAIEQWFKTSNRSPVTNLPLRDKKLQTNWAMKTSIAEVLPRLIEKEQAAADARLELANAMTILDEGRASSSYNRVCFFGSPIQLRQNDLDERPSRACRSCW